MAAARRNEQQDHHRNQTHPTNSNTSFKCSICLDSLGAPALSDFSNSNAVRAGRRPSLTAVVATKCGHLYHTVCLLEWFANSRTRSCPTCRKYVPPRKGFRRLYPCMFSDYTDAETPSPASDDYDEEQDYDEADVQRDDEKYKDILLKTLTDDREILLKNNNQLEKEGKIKDDLINLLVEKHNLNSIARMKSESSSIWWNRGAMIAVLFAFLAFASPSKPCRK